MVRNSSSRGMGLTEDNSSNGGDLHSQFLAYCLHVCDCYPPQPFGQIPKPVHSPVRLRRAQYAASNSLSSASLRLRCSAIWVRGDMIKPNVNALRKWASKERGQMMTDFTL